MTSLSELLILSSQIEQRLAESNGEVDEVLNELLVKAEQLPSKVDSIAFVMDRLEKTAELLKEKAKAYQAASKTHENAQERLKSYLKQAMIENDLKELIGQNTAFRLSLSSPKVVIENESQIPSEYVRTVVTKEVDKEALKEALKTEIQVRGAKLEPVYKLTKKVR